MKKLIWIVVVVIVALAAYIYFQPKPETESMGRVDSATTEGTVTSVNLDGVAADGPALVTLSTAEGERVVAVPSMGLNLCAAAANIADVYTLEEGTEVSVNGSVDEEGRIVPCEDSSHYLRITNE